MRILAAGMMLVAALTGGAAAQAPQSAANKTRSSISDLAFRYAPLSGPPSRAQVGVLHQTIVNFGREDLATQTGELLPDCYGSLGDPIARLVEKARKTSIVIINEDHGSPLHRQFVGKVLEALRPEGYAIYAAEAFANVPGPQDVESMIALGFYTQDPVFARTVRKADALGYELVAYEIRRDQWNEADRRSDNAVPIREQAQADNLMAAIFRDRPDARVVIHVGGDHLFEGPDESGREWMAARSAGRQASTR